MTRKKRPDSAIFACTGGAKWDKKAIKWELVGNQINLRFTSDLLNEFQSFTFTVNVWSSL